MNYLIQQFILKLSGCMPLGQISHDSFRPSTFAILGHSIISNLWPIKKLPLVFRTATYHPNNSHPGQFPTRTIPISYLGNSNPDNFKPTNSYPDYSHIGPLSLSTGNSHLDRSYRDNSYLEQFPIKFVSRKAQLLHLVTIQIWFD